MCWKYKSIIESTFSYFVASIFYKLVLEFSYCFFINPIFGPTGFEIVLNGLKYIEGWLLYFVLLIVTPSRFTKPSQFFLSFMLFSFLAPLIVYYGLADKERFVLYSIVIAYFIIVTFSKGPIVRFPTVRSGVEISLCILLLCITAVSSWLIISTGLSSLNFNPKEVYQFRSEVTKAIDVGFMGYINIWAFKIAGPTLVTLALWRKKYYFVIIIIFLHLIWFGISARKAVALYPFVPLFVWLFFRKTRSLNWMPLLFGGIILLFTLISLGFDSYFPAIHIPRRTHFVPARNTFDYYNFFSKNPKIFWSNSSISLGLIKYPYDISPADLIGRMRGVESHRNNSFLATGYMHLGLIGVAIYSIFAGLLFRLTDSFSLARHVPTWVVIAIMFIPYSSLIRSADLPPALLSHGIIVGLIVVFLLRSKYFVVSNGRLSSKINPD